MTKNLTGQRFGRLVVQHRADVAGGAGKHIKWECRCDCGTITIVASNDLKRRTVSCGCWHRENASARLLVHGGTRRENHMSEYDIWKSMKRRCAPKNASNAKFKHYAGRGIKVCDRWINSFADFLADVGPRPSDYHSIDRYPNRDGDYEPGNVRWATSFEQTQNRRNMPRVEYRGELLTFSEAVCISGNSTITSSILRNRLRAGWPSVVAVETPLVPRAERSACDLGKARESV